MGKESNLKMAVHQIVVPIFKADIRYVENCSFESFMDKVREYHPEFQAYEYGKPATIEYIPGTWGRVFVTTPIDKSTNIYWLWIKEARAQGDSEIGFLAHECYHLTVEILRLAGLKEGPESEEAYAYVLEYILTEIVGKIWMREEAEAMK